MLLMLAIAAVDVLIPRVTVSIFFAIPLVVVARRREFPGLRTFTICALGMTFGNYLLKSLLYPSASGAQFFDYRLLNRALVAIMLLATAAMIKMVTGVEGDLRDLPWPEEFRRKQEKRNIWMLTSLGLPVLGVLVVLDFLMPAEFNWPILYAALIVTCSLLRNRKLLWISAFVLSALTLTGYWFAPPSPEAREYERFLLTNRFLVVFVLLAIASIADRWLSRADRFLSIDF
jgi:hypothetical protein